jgi:class 3 adenylate cyclase
MALTDDLEKFVQDTLKYVWETRDAKESPEKENLALGNEAVKLQGAVLYADMADSTGLVVREADEFAAEVFKSYLYCASRIIGFFHGDVTAFDGDRVMGVFTGDRKNTHATRAALAINAAVFNIIRPAIKKQYPRKTYVLDHNIGIDRSNLFVARTGVRGANDLVWVGRAANYAAKLAAMRAGYTIYITEDVYSMMQQEAKYSSTKTNMWERLQTGIGSQSVYGSNWWKKHTA